MKISRFNLIVVFFSCVFSFPALAAQEYVCAAFDGKFLFHTRGPTEKPTANLAVRYCLKYGSNPDLCKNMRKSDCREIQVPRTPKLGLIEIIDYKTKKHYRIVRYRTPSGGAGRTRRYTSSQCSALAETSRVRCLQSFPQADYSVAQSICGAYAESDYRSCMSN